MNLSSRHPTSQHSPCPPPIQRENKSRSPRPRGDGQRAGPNRLRLARFLGWNHLALPCPGSWCADVFDRFSYCITIPHPFRPNIYSFQYALSWLSARHRSSQVWLRMAAVPEAPRRRGRGTEAPLTDGTFRWCQLGGAERSWDGGMVCHRPPVDMDGWTDVVVRVRWYCTYVRTHARRPRHLSSVGDAVQAERQARQQAAKQAKTSKQVCRSVTN